MASGSGSGRSGPPAAQAAAALHIGGDVGAKALADEVTAGGAAEAALGGGMVVGSRAAAVKFNCSRAAITHSLTKHLLTN